MVNVAAFGVGGGGGDAGSEEGGGVGDEDVAVGAVEDGGVAGGDLVEVLAGGEALLSIPSRGPFGVVPACSYDPCTGLCGGDVAGDAGLHVREGGGAVQVYGELLLAGGGDVGMGVVEAGHDEGAVEVDDRSLRGAELVGFGTDGEDAAVGDGEGGDDLGIGVAEMGAGEDLAVGVDGRLGGERGEKQQECEGFERGHVCSLLRGNTRDGWRGAANLRSG